MKFQLNVLCRLLDNNENAFIMFVLKWYYINSDIDVWYFLVFVKLW